MTIGCKSPDFTVPPPPPHSSSSTNMITFQVIYLALVASYKEFLLLVLLLGITATIYGHVIYFAEIYLATFETIPYALWWAVITMTTVGYGDYYPMSWFGFLVGCFCAISGILVIAMPVPIIVNNFSSYYSSAQTCTRLWDKARREAKKAKNGQKEAENEKEETDTNSVTLVSIADEKTPRDVKNEDKCDEAKRAETKNDIDSSVSDNIDDIIENNNKVKNKILVKRNKSQGEETGNAQAYTTNGSKVSEENTKKQSKRGDSSEVSKL